jgi:glycosyltransferase involved in cell wall biosynthesis
MLRVTHLLSGDLWAGAEVASYHLLCALARREDIHVEALLLNEGQLAARLRDAGVPTRIESEVGRGFLDLLRSIRGHLGSADLVHAHRYKENLLASLSGRAWIATQHGRPEPLQGSAALRMSLYTQLDLVAKRLSARKVIAVSSEVEQWLEKRLGARKVVRVWNGIADPLASTGVQPWAQRPRRVGCVGRLVPVKGFDVAIDAVAACEGVELEIVGDGPDRAELERRVAASGAAERIRLVGFEADPLPRVASWRSLLLPSLHEGNPISVIEALALGTPVLAAELPGVGEMLAGEAGWIVPGRNPRIWAERLQALMDRPAEGEAASRAARERFTTTFPAEKVAERILAVYRDARDEH